MIALIPAAGYATRLYPLTENIPKALLPVGSKLMIEHIIDKIQEVPSVTKIVVVSNHKFAAQFEKWAENFKSSVPVKIIDDGTTSNETRLGAIGDAHFAIEKEKINDDILWISSDNLFSFSLLPAFQKFKSEKKDVIVLYDVKSMAEAKKFGIVKLDAHQTVTWFVEKPEKPPSTLSSIGIYFYTRDTVQLFSKYVKLGKSTDKPGEYLEWLHTQKPVKAFTYDGKNDEWFDIGSHEMLELVRKKYS